MSGAQVFVHKSQFPENVRRDLLESLRSRIINHKFHYESYKQAAKWLALHEAYSPARRDPSCQRIYDEAFNATALAANSSVVHVIGLGVGGGQKEARLLELLCNRNIEISYTACDVSLPLVLTAREAALLFVSADNLSEVVCDLNGVSDLTDALGNVGKNARIMTLFGIIPNFEPATLFPRLGKILHVGDLLLLSANLAPGNDYAAGVEKVLPQYNNPFTRDWLLTVLFDLGFERDDGELKFSIEADSRTLRRITAHFELKRSRVIRVLGEKIPFHAIERIRVFFSYRHTTQTIRSLLREQRIEVFGEWLNDAHEEGVFLCRKIED
jgi:uncharacterized SAM-dependent methyltransferase